VYAITNIKSKEKGQFMQKEIEVKIQISNYQLVCLEQWLEKNGQFEGAVEHEEYYLDNPNVPLTFMSPEGYKDAIYYLRIRRNKQKGDSVCLKKWYGDAKTGEKTHCDEWEISVSDAQTALELFGVLGFSDETPIKKVRRIYLVGQFEVVIDDVENLGIFVEVELKEQVKDVQYGLNLIYDVIKKMGITSFKKQDRGYTSMAWNPNHDFGQHVDLE